MQAEFHSNLSVLLAILYWELFYGYMFVCKSSYVYVIKRTNEKYQACSWFLVPPVSRSRQFLSLCLLQGSFNFDFFLKKAEQLIQMQRPTHLFHSIPFHSIPFHSIPFHSTPLYLLYSHHCFYSKCSVFGRDFFLSPLSTAPLEDAHEHFNLSTRSPS